MNAELLPSTLDNTEIYRIMYKTLFASYPGSDTNSAAFGDDAYAMNATQTMTGDGLPPLSTVNLA